jgi:hypothetical protein
MLVTNVRRNVGYEVRPRSGAAAMAEIWINGLHEWLVHRKVISAALMDPPDPKWWTDPATGARHVVRHDDGFWCDDCPTEKRGAPPPPKQYCPPEQRRFSNQ